MCRRWRHRFVWLLGVMYAPEMSCSGLQTASASLCPPSQVLSYWFGGDQRINFKDRWFPKPGSKQQALADTEITSGFKDLLFAAESGRLTSWEEKPADLLALILILDQFSRHIYRREPERVAVNDIAALNKANIMLQRRWELQVE
jgi:uncharacterized protein (DUF924 family)